MFSILLGIHILAGANSLITGLVAMFSKKGGPIHLKMGKIYYLSMMTVAISALLIQFIKLNIFLLLIALFTFYFVYMGKRALTYKNKNVSVVSNDMIIIISMIFLGIVMIFYSLYGTFLPHVILFFGIGAIAQAGIDFFNYRKIEKSKGWWLREHIAKIGGSYIAATTAFIVVNAYRVISDAPPLIDIMIWVGPGVIGGIIIGKVSRKYAPKNKAIAIGTV